jgi:threonine dehydrogenase-like Zn-dependent dehydrogenase
MKALVYDGQLRLEDDYVEPIPPRGEVRIRTSLAGICNTDLEIVQGYAGFHGVLGHEFVGVVDRADDDALLGRRVVGEINVPCGACTICRSGLPTHCPQRTALGIRGREGTLAEFFCLPADNLHFVPDELPDEVAVFAEPLAAACQILEQVHVRSGDRIVVLGDGKLGLLVAQVMALTGCGLTVVGHHPQKLATLSARGIDTQVGADGLGWQADIVVECTGSPLGFSEACNLVRPRGTIVLKSTYQGRIHADLSAVVVNEIQLIGSRCGPFAAAMRLLVQGHVDVLPLIQAVYPLESGVEALQGARRREALKILVRPLG